VGSPGAGKSTFYRRNLEPLGFERVNQDALKTKDKCLKVANSLLEDGKSVTVGEFLIGFYVLSYFFVPRYIDLPFLLLPHRHVDMYIECTSTVYLLSMSHILLPLHTCDILPRLGPGKIRV